MRCCRCRSTAPLSAVLLFANSKTLICWARVQVGARVAAQVELATDDYAVLSLPQHGAALGYVVVCKP